MTAHCMPNFDDSEWRELGSLPHDFSSEDLPSREEDDSVAPERKIIQQEILSKAIARAAALQKSGKLDVACSG